MVRLSIVLFIAVCGVLPAAAADLTIGVGAPLSGPDAVFGRQIVAGVQQAVADANASGGVLGRTLEVKVRDDVANPKKAVDDAKAFVAAKLPLVVGPFSSSTTAAAAPVYAEGGVLEITPSATAPQLTEHGITTLFRTCAREDAQIATAVAYLTATPGTRIAIVHDRTAFGKANADAVRAGLKAAGARETFYGSFDRGNDDLSGFAARVKASGAQIVFFGGAPGGAGSLVRQLRDAGSRAILLGGLSMASDDFTAAAGPAAEGSLVVFPHDPRALASASDLLHRLAAAGVDPQAYVFTAYAAVEVWRQAVAQAGRVDAGAVAAVLHSARSFPTVLGTLRFDAHGDLASPDLTVWTWRRGATGKMTIDEQAKA